MRPLKIFYLIDYYYGPSGGTERQLRALVEEMVGAGYDVRLFVLRHTEFTRRENDFPCPIECLNISRIGAVRTISRMLRFRSRVMKERIDVVHAFFNDSAILAPIFCKMRSTLVVTSRRDLGYWHTRASVWLLRIANRWVDCVVCNAQAVADFVNESERPRPAKLRVIYNACLADNRDLAKPDQSSENDQTRICLVANIRPVKRIQDFIAAAEVVRSTDPTATFWVIGDSGDDDYFSKLQHMAARLVEEGALKFLPKAEDPVGLIGECQVGVLTSDSEGLSNSIMEYMACGLAVVASDVGGNSELVEHGETGFLYPVGATEELARRILELCRDPTLAAGMGKNGERRIRQFSRARMGRLYSEVYRGC